ncbi:hypothetical protein N6L27_03630 [Leisingera sp. SS27]|uniref:hypothetical protein n=1 Tax=Leisingera sp. SS27 TaxID=2979462 RepID=UPI0023303F4F|nr:hypothetical protein [Leisingera sp. SS27]MDC0657081.1 hypothetical protein [Leisingera sp. SS27]
MKLTALALLITVAACATPEQSKEFAQSRCAFIGYEMERERVPTLQCVERKFDQHQARGRAVATGLTVGLTTAAAAGAF